MAENKVFLVARRRNEQHRGGADWLEQLSSATGLGQGVLLMDAAESIEMQTHLERLSSSNRNDWKRATGVSFSAAEALWESCLASWGENRIQCRLHNSPDFAFSASAKELSGKLQRLLAFDKDAVTLVAPDMSRGIAVDFYTHGSGEQFETDIWGEW